MFLASLIDRALEGRTAISPRRASRYEADVNIDEGAWGEAAVEAAPAPRNGRDRSVTSEPARVTTSPHAVEAEVPQAVRPAEAPALAALPHAITPTRSERATIVTRLEQLAPVVEPTAEAMLVIHPAPTAPPAEREGPAVREVHTHERIEVRHEPREIERRLETLTRERLIERIARVEAVSEAPSAPATTQAAAPNLPAERLRPRRTPTVPTPAPLAGRRDAPKPALADPSPPPAATIVQVTIGRVEVRGGPAPAPRTTSTPRQPRTGLDDYLRRREQA